MADRKVRRIESVRWIRCTTVGLEDGRGNVTRNSNDDKELRKDASRQPTRKQGP